MGSRVPGVGYLDRSFLKQGTYNRLPESGVLEQDAFYRFPGAGCLKRFIWIWVPGIGCFTKISRSGRLKLELLNI